MGMSTAERQRRYREKRYAEIEAMPKIPCACGCGELIAPFSKQLKPATYKHGHNPSETTWKKGHATHNKGKPYPVASRVHKGKKLSPDEIARRTATRRQNTGGRYTVGGWKHRPETLAKYRAAVKKRDLNGERNPAWRGGASFLPYGVEFTDKFKQLIRERDNFTCQRCGITQAEYGRTLHVHHLDHNKNNNDPSNLVASCGKCNTWASYHRDEPFRK